MKKGIKISLWILDGLACIVVALICLVGIFSYFTHGYKNGQDNYFARVEYYIEGNVINWQEVGGPYCLIELAPTGFEIIRNDVRSSDDYVGVYATDTSKVFIIAPLPENFSSTIISPQIDTACAYENGDVVVNMHAEVFGMAEGYDIEEPDLQWYVAANETDTPTPIAGAKDKDLHYTTKNLTGNEVFSVRAFSKYLCTWTHTLKKNKIPFSNNC